MWSSQAPSGRRTSCRPKKPPSNRRPTLKSNELVAGRFGSRPHEIAGEGAYLAPFSPGDGDESRGHESLQPNGPAAELRSDQDLDREPGEDSVLVLWRDQEARDHQLPDVQARA